MNTFRSSAWLVLTLLICVFFSMFGAAAPSANGSPTNGPASTGPTVKTVKAGESHDNGDVQVTNDATSSGTIKVDPKVARDGDETCSTVDFRNDAVGSVAGLESGDTVNVSSGGKAVVSGTGGTVNVTGSGASATVTNTAPPGGNNMTVTGPGGTTVDIAPGNTATVRT